MGKLILIRHGQSQWNLENRFTGWVDVPITEQGAKEARQAGRRLQGLRLDIAFTSALKRAQQTLDIILEEIGRKDIPIFSDQALNERHYGDLQGLNKTEMAEKFGEKQVHIWRRSYEVAPPGGESLKDTAARSLPYFQCKILPEVCAGKNALVVAHGNSLRAIVMDLDKLSQEQVMELNIGTCEPILYEIDSSGKILSKTAN